MRGVGRRFGGLHAVHDVDLEVAEGERRAILGPNGAGKTTLFNVICGDFPATVGTVELFGRDVTALPARARTRMGLARTYQQSRLLAGLTVEDFNVVMNGLIERNWLPENDYQVDRVVQVGMRVGDLLGQMERISGLHQHVQPPALDLCLLVPGCLGDLCHKRPG